MAVAMDMVRESSWIRYRKTRNQVDTMEIVDTLMLRETSNFLVQCHDKSTGMPEDEGQKRVRYDFVESSAIFFPHYSYVSK